MFVVKRNCACRLGSASVWFKCTKVNRWSVTSTQMKAHELLSKQGFQP